ncbi:MAG TPA: zinc ABC transporter substrate-binding protein [Candidatus Methanoperedens sp.]|nr:zinc ABC transporter substrate-binding protein [Candidatus Methanoperedens sp.]
MAARNCGVKSGLHAPAVVAALAVAFHFAIMPSPCSAVPRVAVSLKPVHALVAGVMEGVGAPELILRGAGSPHTYSLKPSEARLLEEAQVIFWVGNVLESFLARPLAALGSRARIVELLRAPGITALPARAGGSWNERGGHENADHGAETRLDGHLWLDPENAKAIARAAADALGQADPANRERYAANAARLAARIDLLDAELAATLAPARGLPYVVFHDAYRYFEQRYALRAVGSITVSPERSPGAKRVREIRGEIVRLGARCVFGEPQFPPALLATLTEETGARTGELDPLGAGLPAGPEAWFALMRALGASLAGCLR